MNRFFKAVSVVAVAVCVAIIGCGGGSGEGGSGGGKGGKLSGTYYNADFKLSYIFSGNKITAEMDGKVIEEGTFTAKDGKLTITTKDKTEALDYTLEGSELKVTRSGMATVFVKK